MGKPAGEAKTTQEFSSGVPRGLKVVAIGGGTGLSTLLRGLRQFVAVRGQNSLSTEAGIHISGLTAVVTVRDNGDSSGRLRKGFNVHVPGDIRDCLVALSHGVELLSRLFHNRFKGVV